MNWKIHRAALGLFVAGGSLLAPFAPTFAKPSDSKPAARQVEVDGRKFSFISRGVGAPTVVIEPGMGCDAVENHEWVKVRDEVAKKYRVFVYDRAGLGSSDAPPTTPRTSRDAANDLQGLLAKAKIPGPYILVGHSIGGLNVRVFADLFPDDVAGMVLVDATHPDQDKQWLAALGEEKPDEPEPVTKARQFLTNRLANSVANPEHLDVVASSEQVRAAKPLGDKPLAVLIHSPDWKMIPDMPDEEMKRLEQISQTLYAGYADLSTRSTTKVAKTAGHHLHEEDPQLVIGAILDVAGKAKAAAAKNAKPAVSK